MPTFEYKDYPDVAGYKADKGRKNKPATPIFINPNALKKSAHNLGTFNGHALTSQGKRFYTALLKMALKDVNGEYQIGTDFENSEISIKGGISFLLGMSMAEYIANTQLGIGLLFHLKDDRLGKISSTGASPDFFGVDKRGVAYLIEAKGTAEENPTGAVGDAKDQLIGVTKVTNTSTGKSYDFDGTKEQSLPDRHKLIFATCFPNSKLRVYGIDPDGAADNPVNIAFDFDKATALYYRHFTQGIEYVPGEFRGEEVATGDFGSIRIKILKSVYDRLREKSVLANELKEETLKGLYPEINGILREKQNWFDDAIAGKKSNSNNMTETSDPYIGRDGIIVESSVE